VLGLVTTYALRDRIYTFVPALLINGIVIVATLLVGGHYLADLIASGAVPPLSITFVRSIKSFHPGTSRCDALPAIGYIGWMYAADLPK
jgi:membrane-associated phospholipid phosphatase